MPSWFTPRRVFWTLLLGSSLGFLSYGVVASRAADTGCNEYCQSVIRAHTRQLEQDRDLARAASVAAETVYAHRHTTAHATVTAVPMATIATAAMGDTITFADDSSFAIPHRVTLLLLSQRSAIAAQDSALQAADELLARFRVERDATDSLHAGLAQENAALREQVRALTPGRFSRGWSAVKVPLALTAGVVLGAFATSRVTR